MASPPSPPPPHLLPTQGRFERNGPGLPSLRGTTLHSSPRPPSDPHPPRGLMRRWEHLSRSSLQVLFFCLIGVLLVTINSFLARLQAALIRCHGEKSNVHFHSHQTGSHAGYKGLILVFLPLFFEGKKSNSWFLRLLAACCGSKQN